MKMNTSKRFVSGQRPSAFPANPEEGRLKREARHDGDEVKPARPENTGPDREQRPQNGDEKAAGCGDQK
jgi:hypothetical protein